MLKVANKLVFTSNDSENALRAAVGWGNAIVLYVRGYSDRVRFGFVEGIDSDLRDIAGADFSKVDLRDLAKTHVILGNGVSEDFSNEDLFSRLQGENWSPNGEANPMIGRLGLWHTSMSVGDLVLRPDPEDSTRYLVFGVDSIGFRRLGSIRPGFGHYPL